MASNYKGRAGPSRPLKISTTGAGGRSGGRGCQRTLYSFMDPEPKATHIPPHLSPIVSSSPCAKTNTNYSTSGTDINAGEKRKKLEVIELTSDEDDPPLKRRKLSVEFSSPTRSYQASVTEKSLVAKQFASSSPSKWRMPNFAATTPYSGPKTYFRGLEDSGLQPQRLREERDRSGGPSFSVGSPTFQEGHGMDSVGIDMELDVVPCSQDQDNPSLAFPPIAPSTCASPPQAITPSPQRTLLPLFTFTPKSVQVSQQQVPSSATPSDLRESRDVLIVQIETPNVPVFTPYSPSYIEERSQATDILLPPSSFPRYSESPHLSANLAEENELNAVEPFPALPHLSKHDDRIESSQIEETFELAFHLPPPPPPSRKPLRRRTPRVSVDGMVTRNLWSDAFDALLATQKSDPIATQSPRKRAVSSPIKPVAERLLLSEEETQKSDEGVHERTSHEQDSFHPFRTPPPTKPSWPSRTPHTSQHQPSPLRLLQSQTSNTASTSPTKRPILPSASNISAFPSPSPSKLKLSVFPSPTKPSATVSPPKHTPPTSRGSPFMTPTRLRVPTATGQDGSLSPATFGLAYVSPPKLPHPGGSTPVSQNGEAVGISQYTESLADEPLPDFLLTFGESQGMGDWIEGLQMQR